MGVDCRHEEARVGRRVRMRFCTCLALPPTAPTQPRTPGCGKYHRPCIQVACGQDEVRQIFPGHCCPLCVPKTCTDYFDGKLWLGLLGTMHYCGHHGPAIDVQAASPARSATARRPAARRLIVRRWRSRTYCIIQCKKYTLIRIRSTLLHTDHSVLLPQLLQGTFRRQ